jgi:hypothetical protein
VNVVGFCTVYYSVLEFCRILEEDSKFLSVFFVAGTGVSHLDSSFPPLLESGVALHAGQRV